MIPRSLSNCQTEKITDSSTIATTSDKIATTSTGANVRSDWQRELAEASITVDELLDHLSIPERDRVAVLKDSDINASFPLRVPRSYISAMEPGNINDPLLQQVLPLFQEKIKSKDFIADPLNETHANAAPGIIHKYQGRALLLVTQACAIHCRYCFRQHFSYSDNTGSKALDDALAYVESNADIRELILSGGDPLAVNDGFLSRIIKRANDIPHLKRLRIHTRLPIVLPTRVTAQFIDTLHQSIHQRVMVIHCNHPHELSESVAKSLRALRQEGITLMNQSVLLRGINDDTNTLVALSEKLFENDVLPYYLHQLDSVAGAQRFAVSDVAAKALIARVSASLPGFLVPKLVRELPGKPAKTIL